MKEGLTIALSELKEPVYQGSVQNLFVLGDDPNLMVCETTAGGSVFDVGTIFSIPGSDLCRAALRHRIYGQLEAPSKWQELLKSDRVSGTVRALLNDEHVEALVSGGARTHHIGMVDEKTGGVHRSGFPENPSRYVVVRRYQVMKPVRFYFQDIPLWDYSAFYHADQYVVPLENIVRFGVTPGSSIYKRYLRLKGAAREQYLKELRVAEGLSPWQVFPVPIVDFTTKYEPEDRNLTLQEALYISGCDGATLLQLRTISLLASYMVSGFFADLGLLLWDLKWEIAKDGEELVIVDTIDTDSIRVTTEAEHKGSRYHVHFNKQAMRDYYQLLHPDWMDALSAAKEEAKRSGKPFHEHLEAGVRKGTYPAVPKVDPPFLAIQGEKFSALLDYVRGEADVSGTVDRIRRIASEELHYYEASGKLDGLRRLNQA